MIGEDDIIEEYLDEYIEESVPDIDEKETFEPKYEVIYEICEFGEGDIIKDEGDAIKDEGEVPEAMLDHQYMLPKLNASGNYTSDEIDELSEDQTIKAMQKILSTPAGKPQKHKIRQLTGKTACKYCDTIFRSKDTLKMHVCKYLDCHPKNFICRICKKELSKKTFSNHLHETLDCQYCGKKFVNPRNMRMHIDKLHHNEEFIPPMSPNREFFGQGNDESLEPVLDETTGLLMEAFKPQKKRYPRKTGRFECGKESLNELWRENLMEFSFQIFAVVFSPP